MSFFEQFKQLILEVPLYALANTNTQNADYNNLIY
jgi:hypothetical protein